METVPVDPLPSKFYTAFRNVALPKEPELAGAWNNTPQYTSLIFSLFPQMAEALGLVCHYRDYYTLDRIFYREADTKNFGEIYATFISVALEHENDWRTSAEEMNKLQLFSAPLKVLITYPLRKSNARPLLDKYAGIIKAADVFEDISTRRRQLERVS